MILCNQGLEHMNPLRPLEGKEGNTPLRGEYLHPMVSLAIYPDYPNTDIVRLRTKEAIPGPGSY